jgi:protein-S-isoprenylcysteine O-methyltransferase Ste14
MELYPELKLGLLNGWLFLGALVLVDSICFLVFPKAVVKRLWDRSGWERKQVIFTVMGKGAALICLSLLVLTPLKIGTTVFALGAAIATLGLIGVALALVNFRNTPFDQPVSQGLYRISRHPQIVMASAVLLGACIAIGSWTALIAFFVARALSHFGILAEEEACLKQYGEPYRTYMQHVPRYFVFF